MNQVSSHKTKVEEELLLSQLEKNFLILEQDFKTMFVKVQKGMSKLTNNNIQLCDLTKKGVEEFGLLLDSSQNAFNKIVRNCERLQESSMSLEILSIKIQHFRDVTEEKLKAREKLLKEKKANNEKLSLMKKLDLPSLILETQQKPEAKPEEPKQNEEKVTSQTE